MMPDRESTVLLAGIGRGPFIAVAPVLERRMVKITRASSLEEAAALAAETRFDLVIFDAEPDEQTLAENVLDLRSPGSASRSSSVLVVAAPDDVPAARELVGCGVNRVVSVDTPERMIEQHVADLLEIAPRASVRFAARLSTVLDNGEIEAVGQTVNISLTGMLIQTTTYLEPGQQVVFDIKAGDGEAEVVGRAEVVRHAVAERGGVDGIGVRVLEFFGDGRDTLEMILAEYLSEI
jgi:hypothetical protein